MNKWGIGLGQAEPCCLTFISRLKPAAQSCFAISDSFINLLATSTGVPVAFKLDINIMTPYTLHSSSM